MELETVLQKAKEKDIDAWEQIVFANEKMVYHIAYRMLQNQEDAKDISQEIFLKVYRNLHHFDGKAAFSTWVYRIAVNTCIDELRKRKGKETFSIEEEWEQKDGKMIRQFAAEQSATPEESYLRKERQQEVWKAMEALSPEHKIILLMRDMDDMTYGEIAERLEVSLGTVKSRIARAREQLKKEILKKRELLQKEERQKGMLYQKGGDEK